MAVENVLFVPDSHSPYHDEKAWRCMIRAGRGFKPKTVVVLGDFMDCRELSDHDRSPNRGESMETEIKVAKKLLRQLEALEADRYIYCHGNHEYRLLRYLANKAPALNGLVDLGTLLDLEGWEQVPYRRHIKLGKLIVTHDVGPAGMHAAHQSLAAVGHNVVIGHAHRLQTIYGGTVLGETMVGACFGWLGDRDAISVDYAHQAAKYRGWQLGFGTGYIKPNGDSFLQGHPIVNGSTIVEGKVY